MVIYKFLGNHKLEVLEQTFISSGIMQKTSLQRLLINIILDFDLLALLFMVTVRVRQHECP